MAEYITKIRTNEGDLAIDYNSLANRPDESALETTSKNLVGAINEVNQKAKNVPTKTSQLENDAGFITKDDTVSVDLSEYSTTAQNDAKYQPKGDYSTVGHKHNEYLTEHQSLADYVKKDELPTDYAPENHEHSQYLTEVPSEYVTETELESKGYLTQHQNLSDYAKKDELPTKMSQLENDSGYLTSIPSEYVTETELSAKGYLTSIPSEYVTESELTAKGYATTTQFNQLSDEIVNLRALLVDGNEVSY